MKAANLVKKSVTVTEIINFSYGIVFYWRTLYVSLIVRLYIELPDLVFEAARNED